jgi:hypothetical protein
MSSTPETAFIARVHKHFVTGEEPHKEKMHNTYRGGTFDTWYSGINGDLWVEYKWLNKQPERGVFVPRLTPLQLRWGLDRAGEGRNVAVIVGLPSGGIVLLNPVHWRGGIHARTAYEYFRTAKEIAEWITSKTGRAYDSSQSRNGGENSRIVL